MLILFKSFLGILPLNPFFFFHHLIPHVIPRIWQWNQHIENSRASLWNPENSEFWVWKRLFAWALSKFFFSLYTIFTWIWTCKTHDLTVYPLAVVYLQSLSWKVINKSQVDFISSNSNHFRLCPPCKSLVNFNCTIILKPPPRLSMRYLGHSATVPPHLSFHTVGSGIFAMPVRWSVQEIAILHPSRLVSIVQSFFKASSSSSRVWILPLWYLRTSGFWNFGQHAHAPPLKTPLASSPACFNH